MAYKKGDIARAIEEYNRTSVELNDLNKIADYLVDQHQRIISRMVDMSVSKNMAKRFLDRQGVELT